MIGGMNVRDLTPADYPAVLALNEASVQFLSPLSAERLAALHAESAVHLVVEADDGRVAAFILAFREGAYYDSVNYQWFAARDPRFLYVDRVVVAEAARAAGLGRRLYEAVFARAAAAGVPRVTCEFDVEPPNPASARFHARFGFEEVGRQAVGDKKKIVSLQAAEVAGTR